MIFTKEQFKAIGPLYLDDLCINDEDQDMMYIVFNQLPQKLQGEAISHGCSDSLVREKIFKYLCDKLFGMTIDQYYDSEIFKNFQKDNTLMPINIFKLLEV